MTRRMAVIVRRKWRVVVDRPPQPPRRDGVIEAVARTRDHGLPRRHRACGCGRDDDGARIDVRSASRYGRHDFGTNAARIRSLLEDIDDRLTADNEKAERAAQRQLQQQQKQKAQGERQAADAVEATPDSASGSDRTERLVRLRGRTECASQPITPGDRGRPVGRDRAARHQILQMRQHRHAGGLEQARIEVRRRSR